MKFKNKVCIITGGAAGIGRCLAESFSAEGARVYVIDKEQVTIKNDLIHFFQGDIAEQTVIDTFIDWILAHEQQIDILINNACLMKGGILSGCTYDDFLYVQRVGVAAPFWLTSRLKPHFASGASIVNLSAPRACQSLANTDRYSAAIGGTSALTHALAISLAGIARVNSIAPGWIETARFHEGTDVPHYTESDLLQHPSRRVGEPEDIVQAAFFLCDERNSFINGTNLTVDGGMSKLMVYHNDEGWTLDK